MPECSLDTVGYQLDEEFMTSAEDMLKKMKATNPAIVLKEGWVRDNLAGHSGESVGCLVEALNKMLRESPTLGSHGLKFDTLNGKVVLSYE